MDSKQQEANKHGVGTMSCDTVSLNSKEIQLRTYSVPWTHEVWAFGIASGSLYWAIWAAFLWCCSINSEVPLPGTMSVFDNFIPSTVGLAFRVNLLNTGIKTTLSPRFNSLGSKEMGMWGPVRNLLTILQSCSIVFCFPVWLGCVMFLPVTHMGSHFSESHLTPFSL